MRFCKKPIVIDAIQLPPSGLPTDSEALAIVNFMGISNWHDIGNGTIQIVTLEGAMIAYPGDWIIRGIKGELYPCKPDIFEATYELVI